MCGICSRLSDSAFLEKGPMLWLPLIRFTQFSLMSVCVYFTGFCSDGRSGREHILCGGGLGSLHRAFLLGCTRWRTALRPRGGLGSANREFIAFMGVLVVIFISVEALSGCLSRWQRKNRAVRIDLTWTRRDWPEVRCCGRKRDVGRARSGTGSDCLLFGG